MIDNLLGNFFFEFFQNFVSFKVILQFLEVFLQSNIIIRIVLSHTFSLLLFFSFISFLSNHITQIQFVNLISRLVILVALKFFSCICLLNFIGLPKPFFLLKISVLIMQFIAQKNLTTASNPFALPLSSFA
mgnify:FL=1